VQVLICCGGVIGAAPARFLACRGAEVTIVKGTGVAGAGSQIGRVSVASRWLAAEALVPRCRRKRGACSAGNQRVRQLENRFEPIALPLWEVGVETARKRISF
jgi:hypothetical protein